VSDTDRVPVVQSTPVETTGGNMKFDPSGGYRRLDSWVMASIV
jgi:hypothetical protein